VFCRHHRTADFKRRQPFLPEQHRAAISDAHSFLSKNEQMFSGYGTNSADSLLRLSTQRTHPLAALVNENSDSTQSPSRTRTPLPKAFRRFRRVRQTR
jgi:hypothetical protein